MDEMQNTLSQLTGALNAVVQQIKNIEGRISNIEKSSTREIPQEIKNRLETMEDKLSTIEQNNETMTDETTTVTAPLPIIPLSEQDLREVAKLPDCVKELQPFDGNPIHYVSWVHSVEVILRDYEIVRNKPIYRAILQHIRQRVRGKADSALVSYNVFEENWGEIKKVLSLHYADKRDIHTLEHQLNQLAQRGSKLDDFYATVNHQLSLIINKIQTETYTAETVKALVETYRNWALDVFIRGLNGDLSRFLMVQKPRMLPEACSACLEVQNLSFRNYSIHVGGPNSITSPINQIFNSDRRPLLQRPPSKPYDRRQNTESWRQGSRFSNNSQNRFAANSPNRTPPARTEPFLTPYSNNRPPFSTQNRISRSENLPRNRSNLFHTVTPEAGTTSERQEEVITPTTSTEQNFLEGSSFPAYHV